MYFSGKLKGESILWVELRGRYKSCLREYLQFHCVSERPISCLMTDYTTRNVLRFCDKFTALRAKMPEQLLPFHIAICSSRKSAPTADIASLRLNSRASFRVSLRVSSNCSCVRSWQFTPGTSSIHPIHQPLSCLVTAVYTLFIIAPSTSIYFQNTPPICHTF